MGTTSSRQITIIDALSASELKEKKKVKELLDGDRLYKGAPASTVEDLERSDARYKLVCDLLEEQLLLCPHAFYIVSIEIVSEERSQSRAFHDILDKEPHSKIYLLFHGTKSTNLDSISNQGFSMEYFGATDDGYFGKGVYLTPLPEYSAAFIKGTRGVTEWCYTDPVRVGSTCILLGCITIVGRTEQIIHYTKEVQGDSHWVWVNDRGHVAKNKADYFAQEYLIKDPKRVYPRFRITLRRVNKELIWFDKNITTAENQSYIITLKVETKISVYATDNKDKALNALKKKKKDIEYRLVTSGSAGEELVRLCRQADIHCDIMVFCRDQNIEYYKEWVGKFSNIKMTDTEDQFMSFAKWED